MGNSSNIDAVDEEELPTVECIGWAPVGNGWGVVYVEIQGDRVLTIDALSPGPGGETKTAAEQRVTLEAQAHFQATAARRRRKQ